MHSKDVWGHRSSNECGQDELLTSCLCVNTVECFEFGGNCAAGNKLSEHIPVLFAWG